MSEENVEILRGILSEMSRGNFWALAPYLDAEVEWIWAPEFQGIVGEKIFRGPEGVEAATREFFEPWERYTLEAGLGYRLYNGCQDDGLRKSRFGREAAVFRPYCPTPTARRLRGPWVVAPTGGACSLLSMAEGHS